MAVIHRKYRRTRIRRSGENEGLAFDFDSPMPVESPCKRCLKYSTKFPGCIERCKRLAAFQGALVGQVATSGDRSGVLPPFFNVSDDCRRGA